MRNLDLKEFVVGRQQGACDDVPAIHSNYRYDSEPQQSTLNTIAVTSLRLCRNSAALVNGLLFVQSSPSCLTIEAKQETNLPCPGQPEVCLRDSELRSIGAS